MKISKILVVALSIVILSICAACVASDSNAETTTQEDVQTSKNTMPEETKEELTEDVTHAEISNNLVEEFNNLSEVKLEFVEEFLVQDKSSKHYRTEFRLGAYKDSLGRSYKYEDAVVDIVVSKSYFGDYEIRIYAYDLTMEQAVNIVELVSPIMDTGLSTEDLNEAITKFSEDKEANGLYFGRIGMTLLGSDTKGYELMLKNGN